MDDITIVNAVFDRQYKFVPVGPLYIAAALEAKGWQVDFREYQLYNGAEPLDPDNFYAFLDNSSPIIGIGCYSDFLPTVISALEKLKQVHPEKIVILGGEGPTGVAERIMEHFPFVDIIAKGEGETTIVEVMNCLTTGKDLDQVKGICFRKGAKVRINPPRELNRDLDSLPFPAYHLVDINRYNMIGLVSSRGCPFRCIFCDAAPFWEYRTRLRSMDNLFDELKYLRRQYGRDTITFYDELFTFDRKRVLEFCERLRQEGLDMKWSCLARVDSMDEELMKEIAASGCFMVSYGIESGSEKIQRMIGKKLTRRQIEQVISLSVKYFDYVQAFFIWGFPFESAKDFQETIDLVSYTTELGAVPEASFLAPLPLSPLYKENKDTLRFSRRLYLDTHPYVKEDSRVLELIENYPDVFPVFYVWEPERMEEKYEIAKTFGIHMPIMR